MAEAIQVCTEHRYTCEVCGGPKSARQHTCSSACRQKAYRNRNKVEKPVNRVIPITRFGREEAECLAAKAAGFVPPPQTVCGQPGPWISREQI